MSSVADYQTAAAAASQAYGVPTGLFEWQIGQESGWNPNAQNGTASGIAQFKPATAAQYGVDVTSPIDSIWGAAQYDAALYQQTGDWGSVLQRYGTVGSTSPDSVLTAANAQLASIGAAPIASASSASTDTSSGSSGASWLDYLTALTPGGMASKLASGSPLAGWSAARITCIVAGLILIAGAVLLFAFDSVTDAILGGQSKLQRAGKAVEAVTAIG